MSDFTDRINAAPTHLAYFTRGGGRALITQTYGTVIAEDSDALTVQSAAVPNGQTVGATITIARADVVLRKDGGERITEAEWDEIFRTRGSEQTR